MYRHSSRPASGNASDISPFLFWLFIFFTVDFFLHLSARIPGYGAIRPTILLTFVIAAILYSRRDRFSDFKTEPPFKAILLLLVFVIVTLPFVTWPGSVLRYHVPEFIKAVSFFFFAALIIDSEKRLRTFMFVFIACQLFRVMEPLYLHITQGYWGGATHIGHGEFAGRLGGSRADVINPNELAFVIVTLFPFLYYLMWRSTGKLAKLLFLGLAPTLVYALVLTLSRGAFVALGVVVWMIFKESRHKFIMVLFLMLSAVVMWSNMNSLQKERYLSLISSDTSQSATAHGRLTGMVDEFRVGLGRPLFGHGVGTAPEAKFHAMRSNQAAHNLYAELVIEIGLIGLFVFLRYLRAIYYSFRDNLRKMKLLNIEDISDFRYRMNQAMLTVFWMYAVYSLNYWGLSIYYWYLFGGLTVAFSRIYFGQVEVDAAGPNQPEKQVPVAGSRMMAGTR